MLGDIGLVRDHDHGLSLEVEPLEDREDLRGRTGVEVPGRLVGEDHRRVVQQRARDRDALLLAARELRWPVVDPIAEPDGIERGDRPLASALAVAAVDERQLDVLDRVEPRQQIERLEDEADVLVADRRELVVRELPDVLAGEDVFAAVGDVETAEDVHERRLARPRGAHDRHELALVDVEVDTAEGVHDVVLAHAVRLGDTAELDDRRTELLHR